MRGSCLALVFAVAFAGCVFYAGHPSAALAFDGVVELDVRLSQLQASLPTEPAEYSAEQAAIVRQHAQDVDELSAGLLLPASQSSADRLAALERLLMVHAQVTQLLASTLEQRGGFVQLAQSAEGRQCLAAYLESAATLITLSGQLRYTLFDAFGDAIRTAGNDPQAWQEILMLAESSHSSIGATALLEVLRISRNGPGPATVKRVLRLAQSWGQTDLAPQIAEYLAEAPRPADITLAAAACLEKLGLPQLPPPGTPEEQIPLVTAQEVIKLLAPLPQSAFTAEEEAERQALLDRMRERAAAGILDDSLTLGQFSVQPGDWLLMKNPSPYNRFTDLQPGLFTHVGVVAKLSGQDGIERMVVVEIPEVGQQVPATPVELYLDRTLHFVFLRDPDPAHAARMGEIAAQIAGNACEFDLSFRTERVTQLAGTDLSTAKIKTYCAGLLLLCGQETGLSREAYFPVPEFTAGGNTQANLRTLGLTFGKDFISPTGAFFSPRLMISGSREPMYDPGREIEEAVFDRFAAGLVTEKLNPKTDLFKQLRSRVAELAEDNPALARALAQANGVSTEMDLVSAAKAAAVVETLDEIAFGGSDTFHMAWDAVLADSVDQLAGRYEPDQLPDVQALKDLHQSLGQQLHSGKLTTRRLRQALVQFYIARGQKRVDQQFFGK